MLKIYRLCFLLFCFFFIVCLNTTKLPAQVLINPESEGGFQNASFDTNGWTVVNGTVTNQWVVGTAATGFSGRSAYISNNSGTAHQYTNDVTSVVHFYRDITFPANISEFTLSFDWKADGETASFDALVVSLAPTSYTPTASNVSLGTGVLPAPANMLGNMSPPQLWNRPGVTSATYTLSSVGVGNCWEDVTLRLIFTWKNDASLGDNPPAAIDNISLTYDPLNTCISLPSNVLIDPDGAGGFNDGLTFSGNGWNVVNGSVTNQWYLGNVPTGFNGRTAYISNSGTVHEYNNDVTSIVHFYRDITFPADIPEFTLSFDWKADGETASFDALIVTLAPTSYTPVASIVSMGTGVLPAPANMLGSIAAPQLWNQPNVVNATYTLRGADLGNCGTSVTRRLIFTWKNDASLGDNPPGAIDNISLISHPIEPIITGLPDENCLNGSDLLLTASPVVGSGETGVFTIEPNGAQFVDNMDGTASFTMEGTPAGEYIISYSFTNADGCSGAVADTINILAIPDATISNTNGLFLDCLTPETELSVPGADSYLWTLNGNFFSNEQSVSVTLGGTYEVTSTLNNGCEASSSVVVTFTPDITPPLISCPSTQIIYLENDCTVVMPELTSLASASDYCGPPVITQFPVPTTILSGTGDVEVTLTATDASMNSSQCSFTVTKRDTISPTVICPSNHNLQLGADCSATLPNFIGMSSSSDNCGFTTITQNPLPGTIVSNSGNLTVTLVSTDGSGNSSECSFTVTKIDGTSPGIICSPHSITFNGEDNILLDSGDFVAASDNCGIASIVLNPSSISVTQAGNIVPVQVTVTDVNSNVSTCTSQVSVGGLPAGWFQDSNGINCIDGNTIEYDFPTEVWTATSTNCFYGPPYNTDASAFAQTTLCGNGSITARVTGISGTSLGWAGIVMRENNNGGAKKVQLQTNMGGNQVRREVRSVTNGAAFPQNFPSFNKYWLRLVRQGNQFIGYISANGIQWQRVLAANVSMNSCIELGLTATNYNSNSTVIATFDNVIKVGEGFALPELPVNDSPNASVHSMDFLAYPNPTSGELYLGLEAFNGRSATIEVYSLEGRILLVENLDEIVSSHRLDLQSFQSGMYLIKVRSEGLPDVTKRVVKLE